jgi:hypothetical protein
VEAVGVIDHGDPSIPPLKVEVSETVDVGPFPIFFSNQNLSMGLKSHSHHADVTLSFETLNGGHGYPSFEVTNDALRAWVLALTDRGLFTNATNEDVVRRIFAWVDDIDFAEAGPWAEWGGTYRLLGVDLDVHSNHDKIGHDNGITRYSVTRHPLSDYRPRVIVGMSEPGANSGGMFVPPKEPQ